MELKELKELLKVLKANGVTSYHSNDMKLELLPDIKKERLVQAINDNSIAVDDKAYTDEEMLLWSVNSGLDDIDPKE